MGYFQVRYDSRVVIYERKMVIRLATAKLFLYSCLQISDLGIKSLLSVGRKLSFCIKVSNVSCIFKLFDLFDYFGLF